MLRFFDTFNFWTFVFFKNGLNYAQGKEKKQTFFYTSKIFVDFSKYMKFTNMNRTFDYSQNQNYFAIIALKFRNRIDFVTPQK